MSGLIVGVPLLVAAVRAKALVATAAAAGHADHGAILLVVDRAANGSRPRVDLAHVHE